MPTKYKTSPIVESICEFKFKQVDDFDLVSVGLIYEKVKKHFPTRKRLEAPKIVIKGGQIASEPQMSTDKIRFFSEDEKNVTNVGPASLSVSRLHPYISWPDFKEKMLFCFSAYRDIVSPQELMRIGLRFINKIEISESEFDLDKYFNFTPNLNFETPDMTAFIIGVQVPFENNRDLLRLQLSTAAPEHPDSTAILLDLDYSLGDLDAGINIENALEWVDEAYVKIEQMFENIITDPLREIFNEDNK